MHAEIVSAQRVSWHHDEGASQGEGSSVSHNHAGFVEARRAHRRGKSAVCLFAWTWPRLAISLHHRLQQGHGRVTEYEWQDLCDIAAGYRAQHKGKLKLPRRERGAIRIWLLDRGIYPPM
jgi:hypothetical protein